MRQCGGCTLCCKLLPVHEGRSVDGIDDPGSFHKAAGVRCQYQSHAKGCTVYGKHAMPRACRHWNCRWLVNDDADDLSRPDRSHLVIDIIPDYITVVEHATGTEHVIEVVQVWCDPHYRDAHRDRQFRRWVERRGAEGKAVLVRFSSAEAVTLFAPSISSDGQWHEITGQKEAEHGLANVIEKLSGAQL